MALEELQEKMDKYWGQESRLEFYSNTQQVLVYPANGQPMLGVIVIVDEEGSWKFGGFQHLATELHWNVMNNIHKGD